jgi:N5-(carboxyethyl)ornithine synthase
MEEIGFPSTTKENEKRIAVLPVDVPQVEHVDMLVFEQGYGLEHGYSDEAYRRAGARVAPRDVVCRCPIICSPKPQISDPYFREGATLFGWIHAVQGREITDVLLANHMTAIAWEDMFSDGRHTFWRNNEISGEAAIAHALLQWGRLPYECDIAIIGRGNVARGALRALERYGCETIVYDRKTSHLLRREIGRYDVIVNGVLWDVFRDDHLVYEEDLEKMKPGSMIVDISCDPHMGIESSRATTINKPVYWHKGILHYAVDHTPTLFFRSVSQSISQEVARFLDKLIMGDTDATLDRATIIRRGVIVDERIRRFQKR